jgi:putative transposase
MPGNLKRFQTDGSYHFITFSCYRRKPYLDNDHARAVVEQQIEILRKRHGFYLFGYVLMPEHVHLLMSEPAKHPLSTTLGVLKVEISKQLKEQRDQFWLSRYYDFNVFSDRKYVEKLRYMHRNPVERGLVKEPQDWPWSSFCHYLTGKEGTIEIESEWTWNRRERTSPHP